MAYRFEDIPSVRDSLGKVDYLADEGIAGVVYLADRLAKPILVEGPAGTGKTQLAKSVAEMIGALNNFSDDRIPVAPKDVAALRDFFRRSVADLVSP